MGVNWPSKRLTEQGEMAARMRDFDWETTPVGAVATWPEALRSAVDLILGSRFPMAIFWGEDLVQFYNDAFRPMLGEHKHPRFLGRPAVECWSEIWDIVGPMMDQVTTGAEATWSEDLPLEMSRNGFVEETYFTFSYSPIPDRNAIGGLLNVAQETTEQVLGRRRLGTLRRLSAVALNEPGVGERLMQPLAGNPDVPFALLLDHVVGRPVVVAAHVGLRAFGTIPVALEVAAALATATGEATEIDVGPDLALAIGTDPFVGFAMLAQVLPLGGRSDYGGAVLVLGISPRLAFESAYRRFFGLVGTQVAASISIARTYEEEHRRLEAMAELDRAKTTFFSNVSHEFRTPLTLLLGPLTDLQERLGNDLDPDDRALLAIAHRNAQRLLRLVNGLLDFARIEAGHMTASPRSVDLAEHTIATASMFRSAFDAAGVEFVIDCGPLTRLATVDPAMWEKVVLNLLSNAFKFTLDGTVEIRLREDRLTGEAELTVSDTGVGVPEGELPHLFDRFYRVEGSGGRSIEGSGIGLALVEALVKLHGGTISVSSRATQGTTFVVRVPLMAAPVDQVTADPAPGYVPSVAPVFVEEAMRWLPDAGADGAASLVSPFCADEPGARPTHDARIVIAEDNADLREYLGRLLGSRWTVDRTSDGQEALEAIRAHLPDLVIADVMMPRMDGLDLVRALRADESTERLPVVLLSARAGEEARIEGLEAGADDYLVKPFSSRELVATVAARLEISQAREASRNAVEEARQNLYHLLMQAPVPFCTLRGPDLIFEIVNEPYYAVTGFQDVVGRRLVDVMPEVEGYGFPTLLRNVMETGEPHIGLETRIEFQHPDGIEVEYMNFIYAPMRDRDDRVDGVMVVASVVTQEVLARGTMQDALDKQAEYNRVLELQQGELRRANAAKDEFLGLVSHELRTPITTIFGNAELLRKHSSHLDQPTRDALVEDISAEADRLHRIIENLLVLARGTHGTPDSEPVLVDRVVQRVVTEHHKTFPSRDVRVDLSGGDAVVEATTIQIEQVLRNLISNAEKYSESDRPIDVSVRAVDGDVQVEVGDRGIGFSAVDESNAFTPFYRSTEAEAVAAGVGIGLVVCKRIVESLGGSMRIGRREGGGAIVRFSLPSISLGNEDDIKATVTR